MRVLMVHGRSQGGKLADELLSTWVDTLREGFTAATKEWPDKVQFDFPYYADELDRFAAQKNLPTPTDVVAKGTGQNQEFEQFMQSALDEMKRNTTISDEEVRQHMDPTAPQEKGVQNWNWVQAIARAIDTRFTGTSTFTIEKFLRDVFVYVNHRDVERKINAIVEAKLTAEPTVVVGHSLGSVVAYKVILRNRAKLNLRKFITVGSPLGLKAISSKLGVPENPGGEDGWYNAYDERDIVALNPLDNVYFRTDPAIVNNNKVKNKTDNRHGIIGYLNDRDVAAQIAAALT
jgi:hypothetical protein